MPSQIQIFNITPKHLAHQSDVIRMNALLNYGGVYLDLDVVVFKPLNELRLYNASVAAWDNTICNAVIISAPSSDFMHIWYDSYRHANFQCWGCNSLTIPAQLIKAHPDSVHALSKDSFFRYGFHEADAKAMFDEMCNSTAHLDLDIHPHAFGQHLWANNVNIKTYLGHVDEHYLCHSCSMYAKILRYSLKDTAQLDSCMAVAYDPQRLFKYDHSIGMKQKTAGFQDPPYGAFVLAALFVFLLVLFRLLKSFTTVRALRISDLVRKAVAYSAEPFVPLPPTIEP